MAKQNLVLAFDTASDAIALSIASVALDESNKSGALQLLASGDTMARREANVKLVPAIEKLFSNQGLSKEDISCVVCGRGPGSFTGVRIAVATAKGIAAGLEVPLYGVATPDAIAWQCWLKGIRGHLAVLLDAMRGEVYPARYVLSEQGAVREDPLTVAKASELAEKWASYKDELILVGDALYKFDKLFEGFDLLPEDLWRPQGVGLIRAFEAELTSINEHHGNAGGQLFCGVDVAASIASLLPVYTRLSDAEENERKRLASGGQIAQGALTEVPPSGVAWSLHKDKRVFRPVAQSDVEHMAKLERSVYSHAGRTLAGECWTEEMYKTELQLTDRCWWVCYIEDTFVGFIGGQLVEGQMHVLDVVVHEQYRQKGIARALMELLARDAKDLGATELTLEVRASNAAAQALYTLLGLKEVGRRKRYYPPLEHEAAREDAVIMTGSLEAVLHACALKGDKASCSCGGESRQASAQSPSTQQKNNAPLILAIESSCDETAAALIDGKGKLLSNVIASQTDFHARFGGVVPEIASRKHTEAIYPVVMDALAGRRWQDLSAIAVTYAPGLIGALVVGVAFAKGLCWATEIPLIKVNHLEGHIYANSFTPCLDEGCFELNKSVLTPPFVVALLSGGNTLLVHVQQWGEYKVLGETLDDAIGEAYDKVAKALGLGYPGGPVIARLASEGNANAVEFPRALLHSHDYQFSFSGLKTAVLTEIRKQEAAGTLNPADIAASFEQAVIDVQVAKALDACLSTGVKTFCIGGGVASNKALREAYKKTLEPRGIRVLFPPAIACTDNAAMIAATALDRYKQNKFAGLESDAHAQASLEDSY